MKPVFSLKKDFYPLLQLLAPLIAVSIVNSGTSFFETLFLAHYTLITSIICFWGIALPVGYFFSHVYHLGGSGLWWGMVHGGVISVLLLFYRLHNKMSEIHT